MRTISMKVKDNELYVGSFKLETLAKQFKTPLYVYDEQHIRHQLDILKENFQSKKYECMTIYATKAFLAPYMMQIIHEYGMGLDSVSEGDLYMIHRAGFPMSRVVLHGNNKTKEELIYAIKQNVGYIVVDRMEEIDLLEEILTEMKPKQPIQILLRVNPGIHAHTHEYIQTSLLSSKFGESIYDEKKIDDIIKKAKNSSFMKLLGFHCHIGSNIHQAKSFQDATQTMLDFMKKVEERNHYSFEVLNLGGGFGIQYTKDDSKIDLASMVQSITKTIDQYLDQYDLGIQKVMIEPGRSIVGEAGFTLYTVGGMKKTYGGKNYVFVDGGMTDNIRPALYQAKYTVDVANHVDIDSPHKEIVDIVGPCCESGDIIVTDYPLTPVQKNDTIVTYCTGAYGYSMSSNYNGSVRGAVVFVNENQTHLAVRREEFEDLCRTTIDISMKRMFDCHSDMLYDLWTNKTKGIENRFKKYHVPQLSQSVIQGSIFTMYSPNDFDLIEACKIALNEIHLEELSHFKVVLGLEGLRNLKQVEDIDILYQMGFRHAMVTWNEENKYATGAKSNPNRGFTEEGIRLLKRMEELDMIIDLAHLNEKSFYDALKVVHKNIIYSHGNVKTLCDHPRNVTDDQMKALAKVDGLLGLTLANNFVDKEEQNQTLDRFLEHLKHAISIMGIDHICFGFDFMDYLSDFPNSNLEEVKDATFAYRIIEGMEKIGLSEEEIDKICYRNFYDRYQDKIIMTSEGKKK